MRSMGRGVVLLLVAVLAATAGSPVPASADDDVPGPVRVLLLGDSVTQGSSGDWTWRYRLWKHLTGQNDGAVVDFVGPDTETAGYGGGAPGYADPGFDTDHAAKWGRWATEGRDMVAGLVEDHRPDVLVVNLGINDILWGGSAEVTAILLGDIVRNAQAVDPGVDVVLGELPQTWLLTGPYGTEPRVVELNERLPQLAADLSTDTSSVVVADVADGFTEADTYDSLHPGAGGEVKIAAAVADSLAVLGVGSAYPRPLPVVPAVPAAAPVVSVVSGSGEATVSWGPVLGATGYAVSYRLAGAGVWVPVSVVSAGPVRIRGLVNGRRYEVRVEGRKEQSVGASATAVMAPQFPRPGVVAGVRAKRGKRSLVVSWGAAVGALSYRVEWRGIGRGAGAGVRVRSVTGRRTVLRGLRPGRRYVVKVQGTAGGVAGPRARGVFVTRHGGRR